MAYIQKDSASPVISYPYSPNAHAPPSLTAYTNELHDYTMQLWIQARRQADHRAAELHRSTSPVSSRDSHDHYNDSEHDEHGTPGAAGDRHGQMPRDRQRNGRNGSIVRTAKEWMESLTSSKNTHGSARPKSSHSH